MPGCSRPVPRDTSHAPAISRQWTARRHEHFSPPDPVPPPAGTHTGGRSLSCLAADGPPDAALVLEGPQPARHVGDERLVRFNRRSVAGPQECTAPAVAVQSRRAGRAPGGHRPVLERGCPPSKQPGVPEHAELCEREGNRGASRPAASHRRWLRACRGSPGHHGQRPDRQPGATARHELHRAAQPGHPQIPDRADRAAGCGDCIDHRGGGAAELARLDGRCPCPAAW